MDSTVRRKPGMPQAFSELHQILLHLPRTLLLLIPQRFMQYLSDHMDTAWSGNLDFSVTLSDMELLPDTKVLLGLVYRDFLCSSEERRELIRKDKQKLILLGLTCEDFSLMDLI